MNRKLALILLLAAALIGCKSKKKGDELNALIEWHTVTIDDSYDPEGVVADDCGKMYETKLRLLRPTIRSNRQPELQTWMDSVMTTRYHWLFPSHNAPLDTLALQLAQHRKQEYLESIAGAQNKALLYSLASQLSVTDSVAYNKDGLLSLLLYYENYSGGAHAIYGYYTKSYDLDLQQTITPASLLDLSHQDKILDLVRAKIPELDSTDSEVEHWASYAELVDTDRLFVPENLYLTDQGVTLVYNPYEVGPYAMGELIITLPYDQLKPYLLPPYDRLAPDQPVLP